MTDDTIEWEDSEVQEVLDCGIPLGLAMQRQCPKPEKKKRKRQTHVEFIEADHQIALSNHKEELEILVRHLQG